MSLKSKSLPEFSQSDKVRFYEKVGFTANPEKCWNWTAGLSKMGYGKFVVVADGKHKDILAHRISYALEHNVDPVGNIVMHKCDNRACCNPAHLTLGTNRTNTHDMMNKGRGVAQFKGGEFHRNAKLTDEDIEDIKNRYASGERQPEIAARYGVGQPAISRIINNKRWKQSNSLKINQLCPG